MELNTKKEYLEGCECNDYNNIVNATKQNKLCEVPPFLMLHLKRSSCNTTNNFFLRRMHNISRNVATIGSAKI